MRTKSRDHHTCVVAIFLFVLIASASVLAQGQSPPTTRMEQLEAIRRDKIATLWPETQSPLVEQEVFGQ